MIAIKERSLWLGGRLQKYRVLKSTIPKSKVEVFFIDFPALFDRSSLYVDKGVDYWDNFFRFSFFTRAVLEFTKAYGFAPHIVHSNDWQTALAPVLIKTVYAGDSTIGSAGSVLTIHNLAFQGIFDKGFMECGDLSPSLFNINMLEFWGQINLLKGGLVFADAITTVSPTYAKEIQTTDYGYGLEGLLTKLSGKLTGILNGIDYSIWNPEIDELIPHNFSVEDLSGKAKCKAVLQKQLGLPVHDDICLIGMVSRLVDQKGLDLVAETFDNLMKLDVQMVLLGTGMPEYLEFFENMAIRYPRKFAAVLEFDEKLSHLIEAGSDLFLMPSMFEPCGLNQLYSLRYGTIPIVRATGGLKDTVNPATQSSIESGRGTGFRFEKYHSETMQKTIKTALKLYYQKPELWRKLVINAMNKDYSWGASAARYVRLYKSVVEKKLSEFSV